MLNISDFYGSKAVPEKYFGSSAYELKCFYDALRETLMGASVLRDVLINTWQNDMTHHSMYLPDGYFANMATVIDVEDTIRIAGEDIPLLTKDLGTAERSVSNCPNAIHAIDGYIVREMHRRCNYDKQHIERMKYLFDKADYLVTTQPNKFSYRNQEEMSYEDLQHLGKLGQLIYLNEATGMSSTRLLDCIYTEYHVLNMPDNMVRSLRHMLSLMDKYNSFELVTIHDNFKCLPNYANIMRKHYNIILADITSSNMLPWTISQLSDTEMDLTMLPPNKQVSFCTQSLLNANYAIC